MKNNTYKIIGVVTLFPQKGGWYYVSVPIDISESLLSHADRGLIAIRATIGGYNWDTSLLPKGDGTHFIALPQKTRTAASISLGDTAHITFTLRKR